MRAMSSLIAILTLSAFCQGCGIFSGFGAGIGAGVPRYADVPVAEEQLDSHAVGVSTRPDDPAAAVESTKTARRRVGSHWAEGFGIGLAIDIALTIAAASVIAYTNTAGPWGK